MGSNGSFTGSGATSLAPAVLMSGSSETYAFTPQQNLPRGPTRTGVLQAVLFSLGGTTFPQVTSLPTGDNNSNYDPTSVVISANFSPFAKDSNIFVDYAVTGLCNGSSVYINLYALYNSGNLAPISGGLLGNPNSGDLASSIIGTGEVVGLPFNSNVPLALCAFRAAGGSVAECGAPGDYILVLEFNNLGSTAQTATVTTSSPTPVTAITVTTSAQKGAFLYGTVAFFDVNNLIGSAESFYVGIANAGSGAIVTSVTTPSLGPSPTLSFTVVGDDVNVDVIGVSGQTFKCTFNYVVIPGGP